MTLLSVRGYCTVADKSGEIMRIWGISIFSWESSHQLTIHCCCPSSPQKLHLTAVALRDLAVSGPRQSNCSGHGRIVWNGWKLDHHPNLESYCIDIIYIYTYYNIIYIYIIYGLFIPTISLSSFNHHQPGLPSFPYDSLMMSLGKWWLNGDWLKGFFMMFNGDVVG